MLYDSNYYVVHNLLIVYMSVMDVSSKTKPFSVYNYVTVIKPFGQILNRGLKGVALNKWQN